LKPISVQRNKWVASASEKPRKNDCATVR
jgi:hypothetical protein